MELECVAVLCGKYQRIAFASMHAGCQCFSVSLKALSSPLIILNPISANDVLSIL
jgi:hypothetical protein